MIALAGLFVGAGLALWFSVLALGPVIVIVVLLAASATVVGAAGVASCAVGRGRRRGGRAIVRGRGARWRYLPSDWLSRRESRAPRLGAAPEPVPGKPC